MEIERVVVRAVGGYPLHGRSPYKLRLVGMAGTTAGCVSALQTGFRRLGQSRHLGSANEIYINEDYALLLLLFGHPFFAAARLLTRFWYLHEGALFCSFCSISSYTICF